MPKDTFHPLQATEEQFPWEATAQKNAGTAKQDPVISPETSATQNYPWEEISIKDSRNDALPADSILRPSDSPRQRAPVKTTHKNWPPCYPLIRHDIHADIPEVGQKYVATDYLLWKLLCILYVLNLAAVISFRASDHKDYNSIGGLVLAIGYLILMPLITFFTWHLSVYHAVKKNRTVLFLSFFVMFFIQICKCIFLAVGIFDGGGGGIVACTKMFSSGHILQGVFSLVCSLYIVVWLIMACKHFYLVGVLYRHGGHSLEAAKREAILHAAQSKTVQKTAANAAMNSV